MNERLQVGDAGTIVADSDRVVVHGDVDVLRAGSPCILQQLAEHGLRIEGMSKIGNQTVLVRFETNSAHGGLPDSHAP